MTLNTICKFSNKAFEIRDDDIEFYEKIGVPLPALCPDERKRRRLAYRNEHKLYRRKSDLSGKPIISFFHSDAPYKVYSHDEWWSDSWNPMDFGRDFDFSRPFFKQFHELQLDVPRQPLVNNNAVNSDFCNFADRNKNSYLITSSNDNEDCYYDFLIVKCKNAIDCLWCTDSELLYECIDCINCFNLRYAENCKNCSDSAFLLDCQSVKNCLLCIGLRNKEYHIMNKPCGKEEYQKMLQDISGNHAKYQEILEGFERFKKDRPIRRANNFASCENVTGDNIYNSRNIHHGFDVYDSRDLAYVHDGLKGADCYDISFFDGAELCYESTSLIGYGCRFTIYCRDSYNLTYCDSCYGCKNCFGCVGLRNKEYCVFNKQYSKEAYDELYKKIVQHMRNSAEYGEFFPIEFSLFAYNETLAQDYFPVTKDEAIKNNWSWREESAPSKADKIIPANRLPDDIKNTPDDILNWAIKCEETDQPFRIISQELKFYREYDLPIPRCHPDMRRKKRIEKRNPRKLYERNCEKCETKIRVTYAPDRPEKIYCENCYLKNIY